MEVKVTAGRRGGKGVHVDIRQGPSSGVKSACVSELNSIFNFRHVVNVTGSGKFAG